MSGRGFFFAITFIVLILRQLRSVLLNSEVELIDLVSLQIFKHYVVDSPQDGPFVLPSAALSFFWTLCVQVIMLIIVVVDLESTTVSIC